MAYQLAIIAGFGFIGVAMAYLGVKLGKENGPVQFLFLSVGMLFSLLMTSLSAIFAPAGVLVLIETITHLLTITFLVTVFYFIVEFLKAAFNIMKGNA